MVVVHIGDQAEDLFWEVGFDGGFGDALEHKVTEELLRVIEGIFVFFTGLGNKTVAN